MASLACSDSNVAGRVFVSVSTGGMVGGFSSVIVATGVVVTVKKTAGVLILVSGVILPETQPDKVNAMTVQK